MGNTKRVSIDASKITSWDTFHEVFTQVMGFPGFYGRNMDAWIDCMLDFDKPDTTMMCLSVDIGGEFIVELLGGIDFAREKGEIYQALWECVEFVNERKAAEECESMLKLELK